MSYETEKRNLIERYNEKISTNLQQDLLSTGTALRRNIRYKALSDIGNFSHKKILDLGCGVGDFYKFLLQNNVECDYTGYDINPKVIEIAKQSYPEANFQIKDIFEDTFPNFDYIISSSSFNNKFLSISNYIFIEQLLKICYDHVNEGIAFDFLTSYVDYKHDFAFYYEPEKVFSISKKLSRRITIRNDYPLFEFALYIYKDVEFPYGKKYE